MALRKKTRNSLDKQAKALLKRAKGNKERKARIREILDRYKSNMDKNANVKSRQERNDYLRDIIKGETARPTRNGLIDSYGQGTKYRNDGEASDNHIRGLIAKNSTYINNHPFTRAEYMLGKVKANNEG